MIGPRADHMPASPETISGRYFLARDMGVIAAQRRRGTRFEVGKVKAEFGGDGGQTDLAVDAGADFRRIRPVGDGLQKDGLKLEHAHTQL